MANIVEKLKELAEDLSYDYKDLKWLEKAMNAEKMENKREDGKNRKNYKNDALATLGDALLKCFLTEYFYDKGYDKGAITKKKAEIENNSTLFELFKKLKLHEYIYNQKGSYNEGNSQVPCSKHNQYIEAIVGAIYKDKGFQYTSEWVIEFLRKNEKLKE